MAEPVVHIDFGGVVFPLSGLTANEVIKAKEWTGCRNRRDWFIAIGDEDPVAMKAALVIAKQRKGENVDFATADFDFDDIEAYFVDDQGRKVEPVFELNDDGSVKTDPDGDPIPKVGENGKPVWRDIQSGNVIPFGPSGSRTTSDTPPTPGSSSASATG